MIILCLATVMACCGTAIAGVDVNFGANRHGGDDASLYVNIAAHYFDREPRDIEDWQRCCYPNPDDLAVALFLSGNSNLGPDAFFELRKQGLDWFDIAKRSQVPVSAFFPPLERDPGPPYGKAYSHWRKYRRDHRHVMVLSDSDIRQLVGARMISEYYAVPLETAMKWRASERDAQSVMVSEYRVRHGGGDREPANGSAEPDSANGNDGGKR